MDATPERTPPLDDTTTQGGLRLTARTADGHDVPFADAEAHTPVTDDGRSFRNRYVVIDERARAGVVLLVSVGTGHLLDEDEEQPFVRYAARLIRRYDALLFACKRLDRGAREDWGTAPLMIALRQRNAYLHDEDGLGQIDFARGINTFLKGEVGLRGQL